MSVRPLVESDLVLPATENGPPRCLAVHSGAAGLIAMLRSWKPAGAHILSILLNGGGQRLPEFGIALDKFGREVGEQAEYVLGYERLAIARR